MAHSSSEAPNVPATRYRNRDGKRMELKTRQVHSDRARKSTTKSPVVEVEVSTTMTTSIDEKHVEASS
ncbi:unnamed protein product [Heligmosomoides polygyrus]|uniref:Uncharacterized protein n=1 Tax=Heligmosomoides polygyrus TaxID=6339 RepID=A0A183FDB3_HELPZ|nr:unnamed protein product [Heligmosomoides polygyrus]